MNKTQLTNLNILSSTNLAAGGKVTMQDFHFVMRVDKPSPILR